MTTNNLLNYGSLIDLWLFVSISMYKNVDASRPVLVLHVLRPDRVMGNQIQRWLSLNFDPLTCIDVL